MATTNATTANAEKRMSTPPAQPNTNAGMVGTSRRDAAPAAPFRFGRWIRLHGVDIITLALMGAVGLGVYYAPPAPNRSFPVFNLDGSVIYPQYAYPVRDEIIPIWLAAFLSFISPFVFFVLFQIRRRSLDDLFTTTLGLLKSLVTAAVFQVFIKWLIGGFRPHFYAICQPRVSPDQLNGGGFQSLMFDRRICTGDINKINDALESMPSGHATAAWAGLFFLALYFNAQLKVMSAHNPAYWKMVMFFAPILGAFLISGALTIDKYHHWYDVLVGALIGISTALVAFRQTFASITDYRFNHILLPRTTSLFHRKPFLPGTGHGPFYGYHPTPEVLPRDLPFTREGGWNYGGGENMAGAPGDATALSTGVSGMMGNLNQGRGLGATNGYTNGTTGHGAVPVTGHQAV